MPKKSPSELENFWVYLRERDSEYRHVGEKDLSTAGCAFGFGAFAIIAGLIGSFTGGFVIWGLLAMSMFMAVPALSYFFTKMLNARAPEHVKRRQEFLQKISRLFAFKSRPKLVRSVDPVAGQLAEAAAYYWLAIRETLHSPVWTDPKLLSTYVELRQEALAAADHAMDEMAQMILACVGEPLTSPKNDLRELGEFVTAMQWDTALRNLQSIFDNPNRYLHQSPNLPVIFDPAKAIAEKLQTLHGEIVEVSQRVQSEQASMSFGTTNHSRIDVLLNNLQNARIAEEELKRASDEVRH